MTYLSGKALYVATGGVTGAAVGVGFVILGNADPIPYIVGCALGGVAFALLVLHKDPNFGDKMVEDLGGITPEETEN
jgi:hypothetical protein